MNYQSFDDQNGSSKSLEKFNALKIPNLLNKSVLDIGCNEGFFCFKAIEYGAKVALGIDLNQSFIDLATARNFKIKKDEYKNITFKCQHWNELVDEKFDVILFLSALHYADNQEQTLKKIIEHNLSDDGILILEIGVFANSSDDDFIEVKRSIDTRFFPTMTKVHSMLSDFAYKIIGKSVDQAGDPTPSWVIHIKKLKPIALLIGGESASGKSILTREFKRSNILSISIDDLLGEINLGFSSLNDPNHFHIFIHKNYDGLNLDRIYWQVMANNYDEYLIKEIVNNAVIKLSMDSTKIIAIEGFPITIKTFRQKLKKHLEREYFYIWKMNR